MGEGLHFALKEAKAKTHGPSYKAVQAVMKVHVNLLLFHRLQRMWPTEHVEGQLILDP